VRTLLGNLFTAAYSRHKILTKLRPSLSDS